MGSRRPSLLQRPDVAVCAGGDAERRRQDSLDDNCGIECGGTCDDRQRRAPDEGYQPQAIRKAVDAGYMVGVHHNHSWIQGRWKYDPVA